MSIEKELTLLLGKEIRYATSKELYVALHEYVNRLIKERPLTSGQKKLYYISAEFLTGKQLGKNLINLGIRDEVETLFKNNGQDLEEVEDKECEPSLGNGGLGRLAACFLDSIATLELNGDGIGLLYHFGLFKQDFKDNKQYELPDTWFHNHFAIHKTDISFPVSLAGKTYTSVMYDMDVIGYKKGHTKLHLFDIEGVDESIVKDSINFDKTLIDKNLTLFLYPDDSDKEGQLLRIYQQYFMVSNAAQLILKEQKEAGHNLKDLALHVAIQINDTHPSMIIPEMIRLLMQEGMTMKEAADIITDTCGYTNHTILAEALEKWPLEYLEEVVPQLIPIINGLDFATVCAYHNNPYLNIIDKEHRVHMASLDIHYSHSTNGVANLHTEILKQQELRSFFQNYPYRFNNKTNGITFRRWLMHANPELSSYIDELIGENWKENATELERLFYFYNDEGVLNRLEQIKHDNKVRAMKFIREKEGIEINPDGIICTHIKRIHEYKRQQMNALWIIFEYLKIKDGILPNRPITVIFGGKAAPAYTMAKNIIHLILCLQQLIENDPVVSKWLKVVMVKNYNVAKAEKIIPACDISEQISLASKEASGTGNMKFMLNGAVTLGTMDGANVEIKDLVGQDNIYIFGRSSNEVINLYNTNGYHSIDFYNGVESIKRVVDFITSEELVKYGDITLLKALQDNLMNKDWFMTLLDLESYCAVKETAIFDYENRGKWKRMMLSNIARSGFFSSDRTILEYNNDIWHLR